MSVQRQPEPDDADIVDITTAKAVDLWEQVKAFIDARIPEAPFKTFEWAEKLVAEAAKSNPDMLVRWQAQLAAVEIANYLSTHLRHTRNQTARVIRHKQTGEAINAAVKSGKIHFYASRVAIGTDWKPLGKATQSDAAFLAARYERDGRHDLLEAKFWGQIKRRLSDDKTLDQVIPEAECARLYRSITTPKTA